MGASAYVSNLLLWSEAGDYFQTASQTKPLLHLWSLGIEEQFYLIWPLVLFIAYKLNFNIFTLALVGALASFGFELRSVHDNPYGGLLLAVPEVLGADGGKPPCLAEAL